MGLTGYGFALFIFILACLFALLCKYLFAGVKNQLLVLDEKEKKLLTFYATLEEMMDEFNDSAVLANGELARQMTEMRNMVASLRSPPPSPPVPAAVIPARPAPALHIPATPPKAAPPLSPAVSNDFEMPVFKVFSTTPAPAPEIAEAEDKPAPNRQARILSLRQNGLDRVQIARELSVTLSEVDLVLGIAGQRSKVDAMRSSTASVEL